MNSLDPAALLPGLAAALASGLLIGVERERRHGGAGIELALGVRSFALVALTGAVAEILGLTLLVLAGAFVALVALAAYLRAAYAEHESGLTTEIALFLTFLIGVLAMRLPVLAGALAVVVTVLLASKSQLHSFIGKTLTDAEIRDGLTLAAAAVVVLPLLPDRAIDPWGVLNLRKLWLLAVLVMAINAAGYIALRAFGPRVGLAITGFTGGFVSSAATIASLGSRARAAPELLPDCVSGALMSNVSTLIQLGLILAALAPALLPAFAPGLAAGAVSTLIYALLPLLRRHAAASAQTAVRSETLVGRPFQLGHALLFVGLVGLVLLLSAGLNAWLGDSGLLLAAAVSGLSDAHAPSASAAQLFASERIGVHTAQAAVLLAVAANTLTKLVLSRSAGGVGYFWRLLPGLLLMLGSFGGVLWLS